MVLEKESIVINTEQPFQPSPPDFTIPHELTKESIRSEQKANGGKYLPHRWNKRGKVIEYRGTNILSTQVDWIKEVEINPKPDEAKYDSVAYCIPGFILDGFFIEFKSTGKGVQDYKQKIRDSLPEGKRNMDSVREYMTYYDIVLSNVSDSKSPEEILEDSIKPQVKRMGERRLLKGLIFLRDKKA